MLEAMLAKLGLKYDNLNETEKETYKKMAESLAQSQITPDRLKDYVSQLKVTVENELIDEPEFKYIIIPNRKHIFLKARLKNYILLESFLLSPDKAKRAVENMLKVGI